MIYGQLLLASFLWGMNIIIVKYNSYYFNSFFLVFLKLLISSLSLLVIIYYKKIKFEKTNLYKLLLITTLVNVLNFILTYISLPLISGVTSATINCLSPLIIILLIVITSKNKLSFKKLVIVLMIITGYLFTIDFKIIQLTLGHYLMFSGLVLYNIGNLLVRKYKDINHLIYNFYLLALATLEMLIINLIINQKVVLQPVNNYLFWGFIFTAGIGYAYIQTIYLKGIDLIGLVKTSFILSLNPIFTYLFSILVIHDPFSLNTMIGFIIMVLAGYLNYRSQ